MIRLPHRLKSSCSWHTALFVNWEKWEKQECFTSRQWPGLLGAQFWNGKPAKDHLQLRNVKLEELLIGSSAAKGTLAWLCCLVPTTAGGGDSYMNHDWGKGSYHLKVVVGIFIKVKGVFLHYRENSNVIEKFSVFLLADR